MTRHMPSLRIPQTGTVLLCGLLLLMVPLLLASLGELLRRCLANAAGEFAGLQNFAAFFATPGLPTAMINTLCIGAVVTALTLLLAFIIAYGLTHTKMPGKRLFGSLALLPLFVPSLLPAIGLVYLLGEQGPLRWLLCGCSLYGPIGIILGGVMFALPHAVLLLRAALGNIDHRQYVAAASLGAGPLRRLLTVTLPNAQYGIVSAGVAVFILTITDFGVPKVVGGNFPMLATEIYVLVIGQHNFSVGAATSFVLLLPSVLAVGLDLWARSRQNRLRSGQTPFEPAPQRVRDVAFALGTGCIEGALCCAVGIVVLASFAAFWPYDLSPSLENYDFATAGFSWTPLLSSVTVAVLTALFGCTCLVAGAYALERLPASALCKGAYRCCILLPLGLPGTTLGLAYVFAFARPGTPWSFLYGTTALLVMNCVTHFASVTHMTAVGVLSRLEGNYELVGASLGAPLRSTFFSVIAPQCRAVFGDMALYLFVSAMSTVSAVVFLCDADMTLASVGIVAMYDAGNLGAAAAMGTLLLAVTLTAAVVHAFWRRATHNTGALL